jgi:hypothetical protein
MAARTSRFRKETRPGHRPSRPDESRRPGEKEGQPSGRRTLSAEGVFLIQAGRIVESNRFLAEKAGYAPEEIIGSLFATFFETHSMAVIESALAEDACPATVRSGFRARLVCKNGDALPVRFKALACTIEGRPAHRVVLSAAGQPSPPTEWARDWQNDFFPEEPPVRLPEHGCC